LGITPDQFTVLRTLLESDPAGLMQRDLAQSITSDPNTIGSLLERMESAGLVSRKPHEKDRRAHRIQLSASGRRKYTAGRKIAIDLQSEVLGVLPEADREPFLEHLALVANACRKAAAAK
jgi:DNA-binding MarR family transcriptional regulator